MIKTDEDGRPYAVVFCPLCGALTTAVGSGESADDPVMFSAHASASAPGTECLPEPKQAVDVLAAAGLLGEDG